MSYVFYNTHLILTENLFQLLSAEWHLGENYCSKFQFIES
jgi:hypothetical protein